MKRRTFLKLGTGLAVGGAVSACGGHDGGGMIEPAPGAAPSQPPGAKDTPKSTSRGRLTAVSKGSLMPFGFTNAVWCFH
jgi:hypothetical protein